MGRTIAEMMGASVQNSIDNYRTWGQVAYVATDYGIVNDGVTDSTIKVQELIDLAISEGRKLIFFPQGQYYVTSLSNAEQVYLLGDNASFVGGYAGTIDQFGGYSAQLADMAYSIKSFGAKGDGITNDRAAIQATIDAAPVGGVVYIPPTENSYYVTDQGLSYLFLIDKPLTIVGAGIKSTIKLDADIPDTTDVFLVSPDPDNGTEGYTIQGIHVIPAFGRPARHAVHLDITGADQQLRRMSIRHNFLETTGGYSIYLTNPTNTDGFYTSWIEYNTIWSGMHLHRAGDSLIISKNIIPGYNGVDISLVTGANSLVFSDNNITCRGGFIIRKGFNCKIKHNNFEVAYADVSTPNNAYVDLDGSDESTSYGMLAIEFTGNNITYQAAVAPDGIDALRVHKVRGALVEENHISQKSSNIVTITNSAQNTILGYNVYSYFDPSGGALINDNGLGTIKLIVHEDIISPEHDVWLAVGAKVKHKGTTKTDEFDVFEREGKSSGATSTAYHKLIWKEAVTATIKHVFQSVKRLTGTGALENGKDVLYFDSEKAIFPPIGFAMQGPDGARRRFFYGSVSPTTGTHIVGDIVFNTVPTAGGKIGWVCVTAGTPGNWEPWGAIEA